MLASFIGSGTTGSTDCLTEPLRHQQSMFKAYSPSDLRRTLDFLFHEGYILRMGPLQNKFHSRLHAWVALEDPKGFLRPADFPSSNTPPEAAGGSLAALRPDKPRCGAEPPRPACGP